MKQKALFLLFLLLMLLLYGCAAGPQAGSLETPPATTMPVPITAPPDSLGTIASTEQVEDYFPVLQNTRLTYAGTGFEFAAFVTETEFFADNKLQLRVDNGGTILSKVYKWENGQLVQVLSQEEAYVRENLLHAAETEANILLKEPLTQGTAWDTLSGRRNITGVNVAVSCPAGEYQALEVTTQGSESKTIDYYAKEIGLIKSIFQTGSTEIISELAEIKKDTPFFQFVRLYYPGPNGEGRFYREVQLSIPTNGTFADAMQEAYKVPPGKQAGTVFPSGTKILALSKTEQNAVHLDVNQAFVSELNQTPAYVQGVLHCIADTFGSLYQVENVLITVEGKPFQAGSFSLKEGETISVEKTEATIIID